MKPEEKLVQLGYTLPTPPPRGGVYEPAKGFGENLYYMSGCGPVLAGGEVFAGKLGREYDVEQGQEAARCCALNLLAVLSRELGGLGRVKRIVKMLALVASDNDFYSQPLVANAASQLLVDVFGEEAGRCARSAIGVNVLPGNIPVEIELLVEVFPDER